jgi:cell division protein FtsI/penicillin-binding protein 2
MFLIIGLAGLAVAAGWWGFYRGPELLTRTDNARRSIADRYVQRGALLARDDQVLANTIGEPGSLVRQVLYPALGAVIGYTHPVYGQSGLEAGLDPFLRGTQGNPGLLVWWYHLLYGQPPPGLDARLSLDLDFQRKADELLGDHSGGLVLLDSTSGEILAMASHPTFDANQLDQSWPDLVNDPGSPLLNRATQGLYPAGASIGALLLASSLDQGALPTLPAQLDKAIGSQAWVCADLEAHSGQLTDWGSAIAAGCPGAVASLGKALGTQEIQRLFSAAQFFNAPKFDLPTLSQAVPKSFSDPALSALGLFGDDSQPGETLRISPLQMSLAAAALSNQGKRPAPRLARAVNTPQAGWVILPDQAGSETIFSAEAAQAAVEQLAIPGKPIWISVARVPDGSGPDAPIFTWVIGGTTSAWPGSPLALAFVLEEDDPELAYEIGLQLLEATLQP